MWSRPSLALLRRSGRARALTALATALLVAVAVVLVHPWGSGHLTAELTQEPATLPTVAAASSASPTAATSPSPTAIPLATAQPTATSSSGGGGGGGLGPHPPGSVTVPHTDGQHTWSGTSNGTTIRASISPEQPHAGSPVTFTVHVSGPENDCCAVYIVFGDGGTYPSGVSCPLPTTGGSATATYTHTYNKSGPHQMLIQAISCKRQDSGEIFGTIDIGAGTSTAQGPSLPVVKFSQSTPPANDPYYQKVSLWGEVTDDDGLVTKLVVTFGDGTSHIFAGDQNPCQHTTDGWPGPSMAQLPYDPKPYEHFYGHSGTYTLRLTAYSAGCDGTDVQKASTTFTFHAGAGPGESTPSPTPSATPSPTPSQTPAP
jgi:hypothetical protein